MRSLNWHPMANNPLDYVDYRKPPQLVTPDGTEVTISQQFPGFVITIGNRRIETGYNLEACYVLNVHEVGIKE